MCNWSCEYFMMHYNASKAQDKKINAKTEKHKTKNTVKINTAQMILLQESDFTLSDQNCLENLCLKNKH